MVPVRKWEAVNINFLACDVHCQPTAYCFLLACDVSGMWCSLPQGICFMLACDVSGMWCCPKAYCFLLAYDVSVMCSLPQGILLLVSMWCSLPKGILLLVRMWCFRHVMFIAPRHISSCQHVMFPACDVHCSKACCFLLAYDVSGMWCSLSEGILLLVSMWCF